MPISFLNVLVAFYFAALAVFRKGSAFIALIKEMTEGFGVAVARGSMIVGGAVDDGFTLLPEEAKAPKSSEKAGLVGIGVCCNANLGFVPLRVLVSVHSRSSSNLKDI